MTNSIGSRDSSLRAQNELEKSSSSLEKSYQRLASGLRINSASDDAAGLAIASQLNSKARVFTTAVRNLTDGTSAASIAEGALGALKSISDRQLELAQEAANGTYSSKQRQAINTESNKLTDEFNRIVSSTTFNGLNLLDANLGPLVIQAGYGKQGTLQIALSDQLRRNVGSGSFATGSNLTAEASPQQIVSGDFNGDGILDFASTFYNNDIQVSLGRGNGTFLAPALLGVPEYTTALKSVDLNGDGKDDLVVGQLNSVVNIFLSQGDGTFQSASGLLTTGDNSSVLSGDYNHDGKNDLIIADQYNVRVYLGNGNGTFHAAVSYSGVQAQTAVQADFNGDGNLDLVIFDAGYSSAIKFGNSDGTFSNDIATYYHNLSSSALAGDVNGDGIDDLVFANASNQVVSWLGNGDGTFRISKASASGIPQSLIDINGDGLLDVVGVDGGGRLETAFGNGDGTFAQPVISSGTSAGYYSTFFGDLNGDGVADTIQASSTATDLSTYFGVGSRTSNAAYLKLSTQQGARDAINTVNGNLNRIASQLGAIGASTSRFQIALNVLQTQNLNFQAAASRIQDVDVASESANISRESILQQAAAAVLAQANQQPVLALRLLN